MMFLFFKQTHKKMHMRFYWDNKGQSTIEAALLLPVFILMTALLIQPACLLYTRCIMQSAAAEACRLISTATSAPQSDAYTAYVLRRLSAVPYIDMFHVGGDDGWIIELEGSLETHTAQVTITGKAKPLPLLGIIPAFLGALDEAGNIVLKVEVSRTTRPSWLEGSYDDWSSIWH